MTQGTAGDAGPSPWTGVRTTADPLAQQAELTTDDVGLLDGMPAEITPRNASYDIELSPRIAATTVPALMTEGVCPGDVRIDVSKHKLVPAITISASAHTHTHTHTRVPCTPVSLLMVLSRCVGMKRDALS